MPQVILVNDNGTISINPASKFNGSLFEIPPADRKEKGPTRKGNIQIGPDKDNRVSFGLSAWPKDITQGKNAGKKYLSLQIDIGGVPVYGALFRSENKTSDKAADFYGSLDLPGSTKDNPIKMDISGWEQQGRESGVKYISLSFQPPYNANSTGNSRPPAAPAAAPNDNWDDDF